MEAEKTRQFADALLRKGILLACQKCLCVLVVRKRWLRCERCGMKRRVPS